MLLFIILFILFNFVLLFIDRNLLVLLYQFKNFSLYIYINIFSKRNNSQKESMMFMNLNAKYKQKKQAWSTKIFPRSTKDGQLKDKSQGNSQMRQFQINQSQFMQVWGNRLVSNDNTISYQIQNYASDKKNKLQGALKQIKNKLKNTFYNNIYNPLTFYEFHMVDHLHKLFGKFPLSKIAESVDQLPYIKNYLEILLFTRQVVSVQDVSTQLKSYTLRKIDLLIHNVRQTQFSKDKKKQSLYNQMQTNILLMILTFKSLEENYNPYIRKIIKRVFNQLSADSFMNTMQTLRYLQNQRPQIQIMPHISQSQLTQINNMILMQTYDKYKREGNIPKIHLKKVSQDQRRKVVNILVSGFLSQDQDKKKQWGSLLSCMPDSQVYGLDWQSQSINKLVGFIATSVTDLIFTNKTLQDKFKDNPFNPAFTVAQQSGRYLAHIVHQLFPQQFINIIGYSLGSQIIKQFVKITLQLNGGKNLQKVVLLGGVSDTNECHEILSKCTFPLSITNMYTGNDSVLEMLLKRCRQGIQPIGLKQLMRSTMHSIDNTDVSVQISGHLAYMTCFAKIADLLQLCEE